MIGPVFPPAAIGLKVGAATPAPEGRAATATAPASAAAVPPDQAAEIAVRSAAQSHYAERDLEVTTFRDSASGHYVFRVADSRTGQVLHQSPPEALLRFFAAARQQSAPLLRLDA